MNETTIKVSKMTSVTAAGASNRQCAVQSPTMERSVQRSVKAKFHYAIPVADLVADLVSDLSHTGSSYLDMWR